MSRFFNARMSGWLILALLLMGVAGYFSLHFLLFAVSKLALICLAGVGAFWFDRAVFHYARPDMFCSVHQTTDGPKTVIWQGHEMVFALVQIRRALIIFAAVIGMALGAGSWQ